MKHAPSTRRPATWALVLAFALVYLCWGTTYLAIKEGVKELPPCLFGGVRLASAGFLILLFLGLRGERIRLTRRELLPTAIAGCCFFIGGNGLVTVAEKTVPSGLASVLIATTPLWTALLELLWPRGDRLALRGWLGLLVGLVGVLVLLAPRLNDPAELLSNSGWLLVVGSSFLWALGSLLVRHQRNGPPHLVSAGYQLAIGGTGLALIGLAAGEVAELPSRLSLGAAYSFFHLLVFGSLVGFVAYNWLLGHVSAARAGTYAYVNPVVAVLVGWLLSDEPLTLSIVAGMAVILAGVALVRGGVRTRRPDELTMSHRRECEQSLPPPKPAVSPKAEFAFPQARGEDG